MSKHTPGPWIVASQCDDWHDKMDGIIAMGFNDAQIWPAGDQKLGDEMADMRLIAAAPELLEAAQRVLSHKRGEDDWLVLAVHCCELEAAIAKATGAAA